MDLEVDNPDHKMWVGYPDEIGKASSTRLGKENEIAEAPSGTENQTPNQKGHWGLILKSENVVRHR
jgi:hypothetical protein